MTPLHCTRPRARIEFAIRSAAARDTVQLYSSVNPGLSIAKAVPPVQQTHVCFSIWPWWESSSSKYLLQNKAISHLTSRWEVGTQCKNHVRSSSVPTQHLARHWMKAVFGCKNQNSKFFFRHLHGDLNLDEIKNALRLLSVNGETNLMNLIRL